MRAVVINEHGGPEVLQAVELPEPEPGPGEVRLRVEAVALNHLDLWVRGGLPGAPIPMPHLLGSEVVGVIEALGPDATPEPGRGPEGAPTLPGLYGDPLVEGQRVLVSPMTSCRRCEYCLQDLDGLCVEGFKIYGYQIPGGYAELIVRPAQDCIPLEPDEDPVAWSAVPLTFMTAYHMLHRQAGLRAGESVLVHAAGSGMGVAGIQVAKRAGATVYTTASSQEKLAKGIELGADVGINYTTQDLVAVVRELTAGRGVDVVFDHIGASIFEQNLKCLARGGRLVTCGATAGAEVSLDLRYLFVKQLQIIGSYMGGRRELLEVIRGVRSGDFVPVVDFVFPLEDAAEAHRRLESRAQIGKVVLVP
jgi:NADPH:quinone reductase-like Zn-dependent oxidoreductase